jgi:hypothetical protein
MFPNEKDIEILLFWQQLFDLLLGLEPIPDE